MRPPTHSTELLTFADKMLRAAQTSGLTQDALAAKARVPSSSLGHAFGGHDYPPADQAFRLARTLGIPLDWLLDPDQCWPPPQPTTQPTTQPTSTAAS